MIVPNQAFNSKSSTGHLNLHTHNTTQFLDFPHCSGFFLLVFSSQLQLLDLASWVVPLLDINQVSPPLVTPLGPSEILNPLFFAFLYSSYTPYVSHVCSCIQMHSSIFSIAYNTCSWSYVEPSAFLFQKFMTLGQTQFLFFSQALHPAKFSSSRKAWAKTSYLSVTSFSLSFFFFLHSKIP